MKHRSLWTPKRQAQIAGRRPGDVFRGTLAEDYDGIGQYILVALAGSSVAAAYKTRIAVGDFGGGRVIPRGSPVVVHSYRGQLEVFLGNRQRFTTVCDIGEFSQFWEWTNTLTGFGGGGGDGTFGGGGWSIDPVTGVLRLDVQDDGGSPGSDFVGFLLDQNPALEGSFYQYIQGGPFFIEMAIEGGVANPATPTNDPRFQFVIRIEGVSSQFISFTIDNQEWRLGMSGDTVDTEDWPDNLPAINAVMKVEVVSGSLVNYYLDGVLLATQTGFIDITQIDKLKVGLTDGAVGAVGAGYLQAHVFNVERLDGTTPPWCHEVPF